MSTQNPAIQFHDTPRTPGHELVDEFLRFFGEELVVLETDLVRLGEMEGQNMIILVALRNAITYAEVISRGS